LKIDEGLVCIIRHLDTEQRICSSTIEQISREENVSRDEIQGIFDAVYSTHQAKNWSEAKRLSIDEVAMHKGHKDFVGVVSDIDARTLLEVAPSNSQKDMTETLSQQPIEVRKQVKEVSVDMWGGCAKIIKEIFPNATIVFDRFHVIKRVNDELNRISKMRELRIEVASLFCSKILQT
jgi:transposase